jgi:hypothetical protein
VPSLGDQGQSIFKPGITVSYAETVAIKGFLRYLHNNYSKSISTTDTFLIAAVAAWYRQESGSLANVIGNNPFNIRSSPLMSGQRLSKNGNGHFAIFSSLSRGFEAAAYLLMHGNKAYGYQTALNALKHGGNAAAVDFLAALARSSWDAGRYGTHNWTDAYNFKVNHLLRIYAGISGIQMSDPHPKPPKRKPPPKPRPKLPRDFNYQVVVQNYLDPWLAKRAYQHRHKAKSGVDDSHTKR